MKPLNMNDYNQIVFFTGAGMSAESGVPTYRGRGGIWHRYNYEEYACQDAFDRDPEKVLMFHELRRKSVLECNPHQGHFTIAEMEKKHPGVAIVTQNIDGMHQRAGSISVTELHGSLWRLRCPGHGISTDIGETYKAYRCGLCGSWLRPDIIWFGDSLDGNTVSTAEQLIGRCDLFISIGTSGVVWPAAGFPSMAKKRGAYCVEINPEPTGMSELYDEVYRDTAGNVLPKLCSAE